MSDAPRKTSTPASAKARSTTPISQAFRDFIATGWVDQPPAVPRALEATSHCETRRAQLSRLFAETFPQCAIVIPAGEPKQRSNDTDYPYRPHTAFAYFTGWGSASVPGSVLLGTPRDGGHSWALFTRPPAPRTTDEFYANAALGEFWTGKRPDLEEVSGLLELGAHDIADFSLESIATANPVAMILEAEITLTNELQLLRSKGTSKTLVKETLEADSYLAQVVSEMRLVKDAYEIDELSRAIAATHLGFDDIVAALPKAIGHTRGERIIEGVFNQRARLEGNTTGYDTIAASGPHACILHWVTNDGPVAQGDLLLVDAGIEMDSLYTADITRTIPVGGTFSADQKMIYEAVLEAADAAFSVVKPGALFRHVHEAAMAVIARKVHEWGLLPVDLEVSLSPEGQHHRRYMIHGTSHHLGLDVHDCAEARREMYLDKELEAGMVFTIEPGLYFQPDDETIPLPWRGIGVRIEDNILVTHDGGLNLSAAIPRTVAEVEKWLKPSTGRATI